MKEDRSVKINNGNVHGSINSGNVNIGDSSSSINNDPKKALENRSVKINNGNVHGSINSGNVDIGGNSSSINDDPEKITYKNQETSLHQKSNIFMSFLDTAQRTEYVFKFLGILMTLIAILTGSLTYLLSQDRSAVESQSLEEKP